MTIKLKRLIASLIDLTIILFITSIIIMVITLGKMNTTPFTMSVYFISMVILTLFKDHVFANASIGKKAMGIMIITCDGKKLNIRTSIKRTVPLVLISIEYILIILNNKRLGDYWANTLVVEC